MGLTNFKSAGNPFSHSSKTIGCRIYFGNKISCVVLYLILSTLAHLFLFEALGFIFCLFYTSGPFRSISCLLWTIWSLWGHVWSILLHFCSIYVQKCAHKRSSQYRRDLLNFQSVWACIWSVRAHMVHFYPWDPLGPCLVHLAAFLFHFSSEMRSRKIKSVKKDFPGRLGLYLVHLGPYGPFWTIGFVWEHVWSILPHFCSISVQKCAHKRSSQ